MNYQLVRKSIVDLNLNIDLTTIKQIYQFLSNQIGLRDFTNRYEIYSAFAIVTRTIKIPTVDNQTTFTGIGIQLQQILSHLQGLDVQKYLECVQNMCKKIRDVDTQLQWKARKLRLMYRIYVKYCRILEQVKKLVADKDQLICYTINDIKVMAWIIYLYIKLTNTSELELLEQSTLLIAILYKVVVLFELPLKKQEFNFLVRKQLCQNNQQIYQSIAPEVQTILVQINKIRHPNSVKITLDNDRSRLIDDLVNYYQKFQSSVQRQSFVDEIKFLKLSHIPPEKINKEKIQVAAQKAISKKINFDQSFTQVSSPVSPSMKTINSIDFNRLTSLQISPILRKNGFVGLTPIPQASDYTPLSAKIGQCQWLVAKLNSGDKVQLTLEELCNQLYQGYFQQISQTLNNAIVKVLAFYSTDKQGNQEKATKIMRLNEYYIYNLICSTDKPGAIELLKNQTFLVTVLCLVAKIYFFIHSLQCQEIRHFAERFDLHYMDVFKLLNKIVTVDRSMPTNVKIHLLEIEKLILLVYIWEEGIGYETITCNQSNSYFRCKMEERLQKHIYNRIIEIHKVTQTKDEYLERIKCLVAFVINDRPILLKKNYIDQIILCSLYAVLKMHQKSAPTLEAIFNQYNTLNLSSNNYKLCAFGIDNQKLNLLEFYERVFSVQVKMAFINPSINKRFLISPIKKELDMRLTDKVAIVDEKLNSTNERPEFYKTVKVIDFENLSPDSKSYQRKIAKRLNIIITPSKTSSPVQNGEQTPKFTNLTPCFSFGDLNNKQTHASSSQELDKDLASVQLKRQVSFGISYPEKKIMQQ